MDQQKKILLVEDDLSMGYLLKDSLEMAGYDVVLAQDGMEGLRQFFDDQYILCILDVMMPKKDGFELAEAIRKKDGQIPVIFLTAKDQKEDRLRGFRLGGDDYITKPFSVEELLLRIEAILRRSQPAPFQTSGNGILSFGESRLDSQNQIVVVMGATNKLTYRETKLLRLFGSHPNQLLERDLIQQAVWEDEGILVGRSLDVFVSRLRKILKPDPRLSIANVHGVGYKLLVK